MRIHFFHKVIILELLVFLVIFCCFRPAKAETLPGSGLMISPPIFDLNLKPGETYNNKIKISNTSEKLSEVYPQAMNFRAKGENGEPDFYPAEEEAKNYSLANWFLFSTRKLAFEPNQYLEWNFQINVPQDAEPGGHYGVIFYATEPPQLQKDTTQVALQTMLGSLFLVKIAGAINENAVLKEFSAPRFLFKPPVDFNVRIENKGNVHIKPQGEISIKNWRGKLITDVGVNEKKNNILPDSIRRFDQKWDAASKPFWKIPIGRFQANLRLVYGETEKTLDGTVYFWVIPWWFIILVAIVLIFLIILIWRKIKKRKRRKLQPSKKVVILR